MANPDKVAALKTAGRAAAELHQIIGALIKPGLNLLTIEETARQFIAEKKLTPAFLGYKGYPAVTCLSINYEIVHGIPRSYRLQEGDLLSVDLGIAANGWIVDTARTHPVGRVDEDLRRLLQTTESALKEAIKVCRAGSHIGDIGAVIEATVKRGGGAVVRDLTGHGVGRKLQEAPSIPNFGRPGGGPELKAGMVIAVEPITTLEPTTIALLADGWTIIAENQSPSAHFEDTILITEGDPVVLTKTD